MTPVTSVILSIAGMAVLLAMLYWMQKKHFSFGQRALTAMVLGMAYGVVLQWAFGTTSSVVKDANDWFAVVGTGYVRLLKMIVIPLIFVSITSAIANLKDAKTLGRAGALIIAVLMATTAISAVVGASYTAGFGLTASGLATGDAEAAATTALQNRNTQFKAKPIQQQIVEIIPTNAFYALTGEGPNATLSVVFFSALFGIAVLGVRKKHPGSAELITSFLGALHDVVMRLVTLVLRLTPYGVLALMTKFVSTSDFASMSKLATFVIASYLALITVFVVHLAILAFTGYNPITYVQKALPAFIFAFTSRTSAGTLPLTISTLRQKMGVSEGIANLAGSFGTSIGQNGCAGIYPAMLAVMVAPTMGINPFEVAFLLKLVIVVAISSFGIAGVGGGATFAALTVLSIMGMPIGIVALLIAIEPLIDMGRTALNVSGAMTAGLVTSRIMQEQDDAAYRTPDVELAEA
jgi:L-cystine uptake protein TcyP (sodium:dicarboxylate symporter family)